MKVFQVQDYRITVRQAPEYTMNSTDNLTYDGVFDLVADDESNHTTVSVLIERGREEDDEPKECAFLVPCYTPIDDCAWPAGDHVFFMFCDRLCLFDPATRRIVKQTAIGTLCPVLFAAYAYRDDFILYGETDIFRIAPDLSVRWQFSGRDIFVRNPEKEGPAFEMKSDRICLYDWEDNYYELSYEGGKVLN